MSVSQSAPLGEASALFPGRLFHIGVIVEDLQAGMASWTALLGAKWRQQFCGVSTVHLSGFAADVPFAAVYSEDGPVHIELIPVQHGTVWSQLGLHHLGFFSDDIEADCAALTARGAQAEATMTLGSTTLATYLRFGAVRVELIDSASRERLIG
jgi:Glyoxalase/Bleomycin resistance protein/Dioxygenase superfamily